LFFIAIDLTCGSLIEILKKEKTLVRRKNPVAVFEMIEVNKECEVISKKMKCSSDYRFLNDLAFAYLHRDGKNIKVLEKNFRKILNDPLLKDVNKAIHLMQSLLTTRSTALITTQSTSFPKHLKCMVI